MSDKPEALYPEIATVLSPSQVQTFTDCSARYFFKHVLRMPEPRNANLGLGIAVHDAIGFYMHGKMADVQLEPADCAEEFDRAWMRQLEGDMALREQDDPAELAACGRTLVSRYVAEVGPTVDPIAIEEKVEGEINGVKVQGRIDIRERNGRIRDIKTAARKPSGVAHSHAFQLATYVQLQPAIHGRLTPEEELKATYVQITPAASNVAVVDTLVKTKQPQLIQHTHTIDLDQIKATQTLYPLAQEAMRAGYYVPNRSSNLCSRNSCSYWRLCVSEYGGRVD